MATKTLTMRFNIFSIAVALPVLWSTGGCQSRAQERAYPVTGTVRVDGQPLQNGTVGFKPSEVTKGSISPPIEVSGGNFECTLPAGKKIAVVGDNATRRFYDDPESPLTIEVGPNSKNHFEFDIRSGQKR